MTSEAPSDFVRIGDIVLLSNVSFSAKSSSPSPLFAYSEGVLLNSLYLCDLSADRTLLQCCLFRVELSLTQFGGELSEADRSLEADAIAQKLEQSKENVRFGMSIRLRHLQSGLWLGVETLRPSEMVGTWDIIVSSEAAHHSSTISLLAIDKNSHHTGDDLKYGDNFSLAFQTDFLTFYTHVNPSDLSLLSSDEKGSWKFERPMSPPPIGIDTVRLFSFVSVCHQELDMVLGADCTRGKVVLLSDAGLPETMWSIEPKEVGETATPVGEVFLRNVASQKYLSYAENWFSLSEKPEMSVRIKAEQGAEGPGYALIYEQPFRIIVERAEMMSADLEKLKENCLKRLVVFQHNFKDRNQQLELRREVKKKKKEAMFYFDSVDQAECSKLNLISRTNVLLQKYLNNVETLTQTKQLDKKAIGFLVSGRNNLMRAVEWLSEFVTSAPLDSYITRRRMIVTTGIHSTLTQICTHIPKFQSVTSNDTKSDIETNLIKPMIQTVTGFLSETARGSKNVAVKILPLIEKFEGLRMYDDEGVYKLITSVLDRCHPLAPNGSIAPISEGSICIHRWVSGLLPMHKLTRKNIYNQASLLLYLRVCCYDNDEFMPWYASIVYEKLKFNKRLPLMIFKASQDRATPEFAVGPKDLKFENEAEFLENNPDLKLSPAWKNEGHDMLNLSELAIKPAYREYIYNYLNLLSALAGVWVHDPRIPFGIDTSVCVQLSKEVSLGGFGKCGLRLVSALILTRAQQATIGEPQFPPRQKVHPASIISNNCYYPGRCTAEDDYLPVKFDNSSDPLVCEVVNWVTQCLFQMARPGNQCVKDLVVYLTELLTTVKHLIEFNHVTRLFFHTLDRFFPYFLQGFEESSRPGFVHWVSHVIREAVNQRIDQNSIPRVVIEHCYRAVMSFGQYLLKIKRSFQLERLVLVAINSITAENSPETWSWEIAIKSALDTQLLSSLSQFSSNTTVFHDLLCIITNAPDIKEVLYGVVVLRCGLATWQNERIKQYVECVYGESEDLLHLLCKSELLEDSVFSKYQDILNKVMDAGHISDLVQHYRKHGKKTPLPSDTLSQCIVSLQSLCALIHPMQLRKFDHDMESYRNIIRHLQIQGEVYELWKIAFENRENQMLDEVMKYCVQFFYNFAYSSEINQRDLRKFFEKPMLLISIPQLVDLLTLLGRFDSLSIKEKIEIIDGIIAQLPKSSLHSLYFIEVLMIDSQNRAIREIQNYVLKSIIEKTDSLLADIDHNSETLSYYLRLISVACKDNEGMGSQAYVLFSCGRFEKLVKRISAPQLLRATCDLIGTVWQTSDWVKDTHVAQLIMSAVALLDYYFFQSGLPNVEILQNIAFDNSYSLFFTNYAAMSVVSPFDNDPAVATLTLVGSAQPGGLLAMIRNLFANGGLEKSESLKNAVCEMSKRLEKLKNVIKGFGESVISTKFVDLIEQFFREFQYIEANAEPTEIFLGKNALIAIVGNMALQNDLMYSKWSKVMGELITHIYKLHFSHEDQSSQILFSTLSAKPQESEVHKLVTLSRTFLRNSEDKRFYFEIMRLFIEKSDKNLAVSMVECNLAISSLDKSNGESCLKEKLFYSHAMQTLIGKSNQNLQKFTVKNANVLSYGENADCDYRLLRNFENTQIYLEIMRLLIEKNFAKLSTFLNENKDGIEPAKKLFAFRDANRPQSDYRNSRFSFEIMKLFIEKSDKNLAIFMLENKIAVDAVKTIIHSNYENRLFAIKMLLAMLSDRDMELLKRFHQVLEKSELEQDFFETLKSALNEVNLDQIAVYESQSVTEAVAAHSKNQRSDYLRLIKLEFALNILDFMRILCEMCNDEYQIYMLNMPQAGRGSILFEALKLLMTLNKHREIDQPVATQSDPFQSLREYNTFFMTKVTHHLSFVRTKFQLTRVAIPPQPSNIDEREMLTKAILNTLIEVIAGPCEETQLFVGTSATLYLSFGHLLRVTWDRNQGLYDSSINLLLSLLDGEPTNDTLNCISTYLDFSLLISHLTIIHSELTASPPITTRKQTGINVFMLLLKRKYRVCNVEIEALTSFSIEKAYYQYFIKSVGYVEIAAADLTIKSIYFPIPEKLQYLTLQSKNELLFDVDRSNQKSQIHDFLQREEIWSKELEHQCYLKSLRNLNKVTRHWLLYGRIAYTLVVCVNLLLLFYVTDEDTLYGRVTQTGDNLLLLRCMYVVGAAQFAVSLLHIVSYLTEFFPNVFMRIGFEVDLIPLKITFRKRDGEEDADMEESSGNVRKGEIQTDTDEFAYEKTRLKTVNFLFAVLFKTNFLYYVCYFALSFLALFYPYFFPFLLLDIVQKSSDLVTILESITRNLSQLVLTVCLAIIIIYIFSVFGYVFFREYYPIDAPCADMYSCFSSTFSKGIQSGGGIGDVLNPSPRPDPYFWGRFVFDLAYFIIVVVVLLNVLFGIILDTFGQLRDERNERSQDIASTCYICGENRSKLELKSSGWRYHFTGEHSPFAYLAFLIYLDGKETRDCNGLEKYVKDKKKKMDHTFVPTTSLQLMNST